MTQSSPKTPIVKVAPRLARKQSTPKYAPDMASTSTPRTPAETLMKPEEPEIHAPVPKRPSIIQKLSSYIPALPHHKSTPEAHTRSAPDLTRLRSSSRHGSRKVREGKSSHPPTIEIPIVLDDSDKRPCPNDPEIYSSFPTIERSISSTLLCGLDEVVVRAITPLTRSDSRATVIRPCSRGSTGNLCAHIAGSPSPHTPKKLTFAEPQRQEKEKGSNMVGSSVYSLLTKRRNSPSKLSKLQIPVRVSSPTLQPDRPPTRHGPVTREQRSISGSTFSSLTSCIYSQPERSLHGAGPHIQPKLHHVPGSPDIKYVRKRDFQKREDHLKSPVPERPRHSTPEGLTNANMRSQELVPAKKLPRYSHGTPHTMEDELLKVKVWKETSLETVYYRRPLSISPQGARISPPRNRPFSQFENVQSHPEHQPVDPTSSSSTYPTSPLSSHPHGALRITQTLRNNHHETENYGYVIPASRLTNQPLPPTSSHTSVHGEIVRDNDGFTVGWGQEVERSRVYHVHHRGSASEARGRDEGNGNGREMKRRPATQRVESEFSVSGTSASTQESRIGGLRMELKGGSPQFRLRGGDGNELGFLVRIIGKVKDLVKKDIYMGYTPLSTNSAKQKETRNLRLRGGGKKLGPEDRLPRALWFFAGGTGPPIQKKEWDRQKDMKSMGGWLGHLLHGDKAGKPREKPVKGAEGAPEDVVGREGEEEAASE